MELNCVAINADCIALTIKRWLETFAGERNGAVVNGIVNGLLGSSNPQGTAMDLDTSIGRER
jgi:hypothetical protein